ncbi:CoA transferase [Bradyrhizobium sp. PRIMUS42]|uniref:CoA transferase n=1 Tax=Bradyrhizobium sp. PRIMUS42 TaxID=2908926 RepID=UPI001FF5B1CA|nr:CoA transferase [Bradyrhizobium sp. PRIMUS42]MCJ9728688.1 CoA transferase [Bradyrhizobium sp. PRIMUS42]
MNYQFLRGLRVVESSAFVAAPLAGMTLSQFGADVIRIDLPGGGIDYARQPTMPGGRSLYWTGLNKGKRSFAVDIRRPEGRELVQSLVTAPGADGGVLLTNVGGSWLSHAALSARRRDIITCTIEGNPDGSTALDYTVNCAVGFPAMTGGGSLSAPVNHVLPAWDIACAYQAAFAIAAASATRRATQNGAELRIALADVAFSMLSHLGLSAEAELLDQERPSIGNYLFGAFGRDFPTSDQRRVYVAAISLTQWKNLVNACGMQHAMEILEKELGLNFAREGDRYEAREEIAAFIQSWTSFRTLAEVADKFDSNGVCWGIYQTVRQALRDDSRISAANPIFERIRTPGVGEHLSAGTPVRVRDTARGPIDPAPLLGQHTDEVLMDVLGLDSTAVGKLHDAGLVAGPERDPFHGS